MFQKYKVWIVLAIVLAIVAVIAAVSISRYNAHKKDKANKTKPKEDAPAPGATKDYTWSVLPTISAPGSNGLGTDPAYVNAPPAPVLPDDL